MTDCVYNQLNCRTCSDSSLSREMKVALHGTPVKFMDQKLNGVLSQAWQRQPRDEQAQPIMVVNRVDVNPVKVKSLILHPVLDEVGAFALSGQTPAGKRFCLPSDTPVGTLHQFASEWGRFTLVVIAPPSKLVQRDFPAVYVRRLTAEELENTDTTSASEITADDFAPWIS